jgi:hypothetical protein
MKHKHAELIKLWADGAQIQWLDSNCDWCNIVQAIVEKATVEGGFK